MRLTIFVLGYIHDLIITGIDADCIRQLITKLVLWDSVFLA